jgi:hypothetical protein
MFGKSPPSPESDFVKIERERQKTKRQMMAYVLMGAISLLGLIMVFKGSEGTRKVDIDLTKGKFQFSVDKPIIEQVNQKTETTTLRGKEVDFTTGTLNPEVIKQLQKENIEISPSRFTGKNLINKEAGYILTIDNPEKWSVQYNPAGLNDPMTPINIISGQGGDLRITRSPMQPGFDFQTQVRLTMEMFLYMGLISEMPDIKYDNNYTTAILTYNNQQTGGVSYQKIMLKNGMLYAPTANYNIQVTSAEDRNALINMVASFTVIGS